MSKLLSAVNAVTADASAVVTEMPFGEVVLKSILAYASIFLVTGAIILSIYLLNKATKKR